MDRWRAISGTAGARPLRSLADGSLQPGHFHRNGKHLCPGRYIQRLEVQAAERAVGRGQRNPDDARAAAVRIDHVHAISGRAPYSSSAVHGHTIRVRQFVPDLSSAYLAIRGQVEHPDVIAVRVRHV